MTDSLDKGLAVELQTLSRAAASTVAASAGTLVTDTHVAVQRILSDVLFRCNGRHRLLSLPHALLLRIFGFARPEDSWSLSQTCRSLRSTCLTEPDLWRAFPQKFYEASALDMPLLTRQLSLLAERSYPQGFDLDQCFYSNRMSGEDAVVHMAGCLPRLRKFFVAPTSHTTYYTALGMLKTPAPLLEELTFHGALVDIPGICLPFDFLGNEPGPLRSLTLFGIALPLSLPSLPVFANLRSLHWYDRNHLVIDATSFRRILVLLPQLETLRLFVQRFIWEAREDEPASPPRALTEFWLLTEDRVESINVLACVKYFGIPRFRYTSRGEYANFLQDLVRQPLSVRTGICTCEVIPQFPSGAAPLAISGDDAMVTENRVASVGAHVSPALFGALAQLSMCEFSWPSPDIALPPLPVLRTLRLTLASCAQYSRYWEPPHGILHGFDLATWEAPALSVVHLDYWPPEHLTCRGSSTPPWRMPPATPHRSCKDMPLAISLMDVCDFVRCCLPRAPGRKFAEIRLRGVECVDPDPWLAFDLLETVADEVSVTDVAEPTQFDIDDKNSRRKTKGSESIDRHCHEIVETVEGPSRLSHHPLRRS